jgi:hypothetical protein
MANYMATIRTNYFSVTDEAKLREILSRCYAEDEIQVFEAGDGSGELGFGCYGSISGYPENADEDDPDDVSVDALYEALRQIVSEDDAIIITETGYEKLRYLCAHSIIITRREIRVVDLQYEAAKAAGSILGDESFITRMDY